MDEGRWPEAMDYFVRHFEAQIRTWLQCSFPCLQPYDIEEVVEAAFAAFWRKIKRASTANDIHCPVAYVCGTARHIAHKWLRRRFEKPTPPSEIEHSFGSAANLVSRPRAHRVPGSLIDDPVPPQEPMTVVEWWRSLCACEQDEFREYLRRCMQDLPKRAQLVAQTYLAEVERLPNGDKWGYLTAAVERRSGQTENVETVKSLWRSAAKKLAVVLRTAGYEFPIQPETKDVLSQISARAARRPKK